MELTGTVIEFVDKLWAPVGTRWGYHRRMEKFMSNLRRKVNELITRKEDVASRLSAELVAGKLPRKEVDLWLQSVETINDETISIEQEVAKGKYLSRARLAKLAFKKIQEVEELYQKGDFGDSLVIDAPVHIGECLPATALVGETAKRKMEEIWDCLMDDDVRKIGIYGMGGTGKTTIMKHVNNRLQNGSDKFGNVIWVTLSKALNLGNLQKDIAAALHKDFAQYEDETRMAVRLFTWLREKQNWLLILDDMWEAFTLEDVGIPEPTLDNGCKIVLTTRSLDICRSMDCKDIKMELLTEEDAWNLFVEKVGYQVFLTPELEATAKQVADECACLPLAIISIAGSMKGIDDIYEWENALEELREYTKGLNDMGKVFEQLKFSYTRLKDDKLRQCLLYCALYPEDFLIKRTELIRHMIGVGIVDKMKSRQAEYAKGHAMLNKLENASLLESIYDKKYVKVHDLIRDMAIQMKSMDHQFLVESGVRLRELPNEERWKEELERVSLVDNHISEIPSILSPKCPRIQTMLLAQNKDLVRIPDSFFSYMHVLRLLDLSYTGIENLPNSISTLENLAALYLKHCERLWYVPSVAKLHELRELDLRHTSIQHVPEGMEMLINLRYLNLYVQDLEFPIGILPKLSCLEYFRLWRGSKTLKVKGEELVGLRKIEKIEIQLYSLSSLNSFVGSLNGRVLRKYFLQLGEEDLHRPGDFRKVVRVVDYGIGEEGVEDSLLLPIDVEYLSIERSHNFKSLSYVSLQKKGKDCPRMVSSSHTTPQPIPLCAFSRLTFLKIQGCPDLKNLFMPGLLLQLQNLEEVLIYDCPQMEQILALEVKDRNVGMGEASSSNHFAMKNEDVAMTFTLPNLRNLCLSELPELKSICRWLVYCPSLIYMTVNGCPNLKRLPLGLPMVDGELFPLPNLEQIYVQDEKWWESLEWDQPGSKIALQPFCKFLHC